MFIKIALRDLAPSTLILLRMGSGAAALAIYIKATGRSFRALLPYAWPLALLGLVNTAVPFFLIAWGQQYIDSGLAAILNASAPLFTALFAVAYDQSQRVTGMRLAGVVARLRRGRPARRLRPLRRRACGRRRSRRGRRLRLLRARRPLRGPPLPGAEPPSLVAFGTLVWATLFVLPFGVAPRARPAGRRSPPCSTSASRLPVSRISSTSG